MTPRKRVPLVRLIVALALSVGMGSVTRKSVRTVGIVRRTAAIVRIFAVTECVVQMKPVVPVLRIAVIVRVAATVYVTHPPEKLATTVLKIAAVVRIYVVTEYVDPKRVVLFVRRTAVFVRIFVATVSAGSAKIVILVPLTVAFVRSAGMVSVTLNRGRIVLIVLLIAANVMISAATRYAALLSLV